MATPEAMTAYVAQNAEPELAFIFEQEEVNIKVQHDLVTMGMKTVRKMAGLEDTRAAVRKVCKEDLRITDIIQVASVVSAWEVALLHKTKDDESKAMSKASNMTRPVTEPEHTKFINALEVKTGKDLAENITPSPGYLAEKLEQVETNAPKATPLDEVVSVAESDKYTTTHTTDLAGFYRAVSKKMKGSLPHTKEQLRIKLKLEGNVYSMLALKFTNRAWLEGISIQDFIDHADFLLGEMVSDMEIPGPNGPVPVKVPWHVLFAYDFQVRKKAFELVR